MRLFGSRGWLFGVSQKLLIDAFETGLVRWQVGFDISLDGLGIALTHHRCDSVSHIIIIIKTTIK